MADGTSATNTAIPNDTVQALGDHSRRIDAQQMVTFHGTPLETIT